MIALCTTVLEYVITNSYLTSNWQYSQSFLKIAQADGIFFFFFFFHKQLLRPLG